MRQPAIIAVTALVPAIWGSTFVVTTELLPPDHALTNACLRALPAGLALLAVTRQLPHPSWIGKLLIVSALNFSIFWWLLFEAAYRLPGGVAATVGSVQPLIVFTLSALLLGTRVSILVYVAGIGGVIGVALLALTPEASVDPVGIAAAIAGAVSMALGVVLTKRWQFPVSPLTFASWQLVIGGLLLAPAAILIDPPMPTISVANLAGYFYLALIGGAVTYTVWFWGVAQLGPITPTTLGFFSPVSALFLGWIILGQSMTSLQLSGVVLIVVSVAVGVWMQRTIIAQRAQPGRGPGRAPDALAARDI
ncbi:EamA family transporter [Fodinicurvata sp. EGI_FJ10296]|uniref:EamA family transporter n=1 Tax=Fodinicurvata sp. EGI_FJ10296 TaxID=3231908 RepID=UPI00345114D2